MAKFSSEQYHHPDAKKSSTFTVDEEDPDFEDAGSDDELDIELVDDDDEEEVKQAVDKELSDDEELEQFSSGVKKRINKEVGRRHEAERRADRFQKDLDDAVAFARKVAEENEALKKATIQTQRTAVNVTVASLEQNVNNIKSRLQSALDDGDTKAAVDLQSELSEAQLNLREAKNADERVKKAEEEFEKAPKPPADTGQQQPAPVRLTPIQEKFFEENKNWFQVGENGPLNRATRDALLLNRDLIDDGEDPSTPEFYDKIKKKIAERYPELDIKTSKKTRTKEDDDVPPKPSFGRSAPPSGQRKGGKVVLPRRVMDQIDRMCPPGADKKEFIRRYIKNMEQ